MKKEDIFWKQDWKCEEITSQLQINLAQVILDHLNVHASSCGTKGVLLLSAHSGMAHLSNLQHANKLYSIQRDLSNLWNSPKIRLRFHSVVGVKAWGPLYRVHCIKSVICMWWTNVIRMNREKTNNWRNIWCKLYFQILLH